MNQQKIGNFILELRKERNMTQQELADKIGVTDKAISKWENGRGMPDLSLMKPLCTALGITINDLLSGEKIDKKDYQDKFEENILNTINYTNKNKLFNRVNSYSLDVAEKTLILYLIGVYKWEDIHDDNKEDIFNYLDDRYYTDEMGAILEALGYRVVYKDKGLTAYW